MNVHATEFTVVSDTQTSPEKCEAFRIGCQLEELLKTATLLAERDYEDGSCLASGLNRQTASERAQMHIYDKVETLERLICDVHATSLEGALYQASLLYHRDPKERETENRRREHQRQNQRLAVSITRCLEAHLGKTRDDLGFGSQMPSDSYEDNVAELLADTSAAV